MSSPDFGLLDPLRQGSPSGQLLGDPAWLQAMVDVEVGLLRALIGAGLVPESQEAVAAALSNASALDLESIAVAGRGGGNPVIPLVAALAARAESISPGASDAVHVGVTSQDILDSAAMLVGRRVSESIAAELRALGTELAALADRHRATPMPGRTLGQHAAPTSFGLVVAGWLDGVLGSLERLEAVARELPLSLGGSVGTLGVLMDVAAARLPEVAPEQSIATVLEELSARLGLRNPSSPWHTNRLPIVELGAALASVVGALGTMAADVGVLSRTEISEVSERLGDGEGTSSAMPHKRNPVTAVLLSSAARRVPGLLTTLYASQAAEDQRPSGAWHAEWEALRALERLTLDAATAARSLAGRLDVDAERMRSNLDLTDGLIYSERVSTILGEALGKKAAFTLVAAASREAVDTHRPLRIVVAASLDNEDDSLRARVWAAFDPDTALGASGQIIDRVLARAKEIL